MLRREMERLKRRIVQIGSRSLDDWRRAMLLFRVAEKFSRAAFHVSYCQGESMADGCASGRCCQCRPDVFLREEQVLALLPMNDGEDGYCPFFDRRRRNCGIYSFRPLACRIFYNIGGTPYFCQNPCDSFLAFFDSLKPHVQRILGPYRGGFQGAVPGHPLAIHDKEGDMEDVRRLIAVLQEINQGRSCGANGRGIAMFTPALVGMIGTTAMFDRLLADFDAAITAAAISDELRARAKNLSRTYVPQVASLNSLDLTGVEATPDELRAIRADSPQNRRSGVAVILAAMQRILETVGRLP